MPQTFKAPVELIVKAVGAAVVLGAVALAFLLVDWNRAGQRVDQSLAQPIPFSHKHHVGDVGLDCRFCHVTVETRATPGLPSAQLCLTCHSQLFADQPMFEPLRASLASGGPVAWQHVNRLPDYVYFDHSVHIAKQVACVECHGRVDQLPLIAKPQRLEMKWCIACHENPTPRLHAAGDVFDPHSASRERLPAADLEALHRLLKIESRERLTDCSTCHR